MPRENDGSAAAWWAAWGLIVTCETSAPLLTVFFHYCWLPCNPPWALRNPSSAVLWDHFTMMSGFIEVSLSMLLCYLANKNFNLADGSFWWNRDYILVLPHYMELQIKSFEFSLYVRNGDKGACPQLKYTSHAAEIKTLYNPSAWPNGSACM